MSIPEPTPSEVVGTSATDPDQPSRKTGRFSDPPDGPSRKTGRFSDPPVEPSRKTGRFSDPPVEPSRKTGRFDASGWESADGPALLVDAVIPAADFPSPYPPDPDLPVPTPEHPGLGVRVGRRRRLQAIAATQEGCFTVAQARAAGLDRRARYHHISYGNWRRTVAPSVFRLSHWPHDPYEHLRAWLLWAGPGASLTSWSGLELLGRTVVGPHATVHLVFGPHPAWRNDRRRSVPEVDGQAGPAARLHHVRAPELDDVTIAGMAVRPVEESLATALMTASTASIETLLLHELIAREIERDDEARIRLLLTAQSMAATRLTELIYDPRVLADLRAPSTMDEDASVADVGDEPDEP